MAADYGGLDGLVDKYKEHFGGWAAKLFLIIIGLGVLAITIGVALQWIVRPILALFEASPAIAYAANLLVLFFLAVAGGYIIAGVVMLRRLKSVMRRQKMMTAETEDLMGRARAFLDESKAATKELKPLAETLLERAQELAKRGD